MSARNKGIEAIKIFFKKSNTTFFSINVKNLFLSAYQNLELKLKRLKRKFKEGSLRSDIEIGY